MNTKEYKIIVTTGGYSIPEIQDMLNNGWYIDRVDTSKGTFIYVLFKYLPIK